MYIKWMKVKQFNGATFLLEWWASTLPNVSSQLILSVIWSQCLLRAIQKEKMRKFWQNHCYFSFFDLYFIAGLGKKEDLIFFWSSIPRLALTCYICWQTVDYFQQRTMICTSLSVAWAGIVVITLSVVLHAEVGIPEAVA